MADKDLERLFGKCEELGWEVSVDDDTGDVELGQYSPAGEDFSFCVSGEDYDSSEDFARSVWRCAEEFDADEHIEFWIKAKAEGVSSVPKVRVLVEDADAIDRMLTDLADALMELVKNSKRKSKNEKEYG